MIESLLKFIGAIALVILNTIMTGWVLTKLWIWFVVSIFNVPPLTIIQAIGLSFTMSIFLNTASKLDEKKDITLTIIEGLLRPLFILLIAYLFHSFQ